MSVLRSIGAGTLANAVGQLAQLAFIPYVTRIVVPETYGYYMIFQLGTAVAALLCGLQYNSAIVLCAGRNAALAVASLVILLGGAVCLLVLLAWAVTFLALPVSDSGNIAWAIGALGIYCAANTLQRIGMAYEIRAGRFQNTALSSAANALGMIGMQLLLLQSGGDGLLALIWGFVAGQVLSLLPMLPRLREVGTHLIARSFSRRKIGWALRHYARFPRYMLLFALNGALRDRLVQLLIGAYSSAGSLGKLALAQRLTAAPQSLLHQGVSPVLFSYASHNSRDATARLASGLVEIVFITLAPIFLWIWLVIPRLSLGLLGVKWQGIENYISWLLLPSLLLVSTSFVDKLFDVFKTQKQLMLLETAYSAVLLLSLLVVCEMGLGAYAIQTYSMIFTLYLLTCIYLAFRTCELPIQHLLRACGAILIALTVYLPIIFVGHYFIDQSLMVVFTVTSYILYLTLYMTWRGRDNVRLLYAPVGR